MQKTLSCTQAITSVDTSEAAKDHFLRSWRPTKPYFINGELFIYFTTEYGGETDRHTALPVNLNSDGKSFSLKGSVEQKYPYISKKEYTFDEFRSLITIYLLQKLGQSGSLPPIYAKNDFIKGPNIFSASNGDYLVYGKSGNLQFLQLPKPVERHNKIRLNGVSQDGTPFTEISYKFIESAPFDPLSKVRAQFEEKYLPHYSDDRQKILDRLPKYDVIYPAQQLIDFIKQLNTAETVMRSINSYAKWNFF